MTWVSKHHPILASALWFRCLPQLSNALRALYADFLAGLIDQKIRVRFFVVQDLGFLWVEYTVTESDQGSRSRGLKLEIIDSPNLPVTHDSPVTSYCVDG